MQLIRYSLQRAIENGRAETGSLQEPVRGIYRQEWFLWEEYGREAAFLHRPPEKDWGLV